MPNDSDANKTTNAVTVVAFDFGLRHIGCAVGQTVTGTATPIDTARADQGKPDWRHVATLLATWNPDLLIVGLPLNMDGTESDMSARARKFADQLHKRFDLPVSLVDERLTSFEAGPSAKDERSHADAARLIAESWLRTRS